MTYAYAGNYTVKLKASNSDGSDTIIATDFITVLEPAPMVANFTASPRSGQAPLTVMFDDTSEGDAITLWYWEFGDGTDASVQNPVHTYTQAGNYTVSFEIANSVGSDTTTRVDYITVSNPPVTTIPTTVPTTTLTTVPTTSKPTPTRTHAPLSLQVTVVAITIIGLLFKKKMRIRRKE
jgi:PKD repeat protein